MVSTDDAYVQADITILSAKVSGYVSSLAVGHNQSVKAGDLIATIDDGDYRLARQSAMDKLATQQSAIARIGRQIEAEKAAVAKAEAQVAAAQADAQQAASRFRAPAAAREGRLRQQGDLRDRAGRPRSRQRQREERPGVASWRPRPNVEVLAAQQVEAERLRCRIADRRRQSRARPVLH